MPTSRVSRTTRRLSQADHRHLAMLLATVRVTAQQVWLHLANSIGSNAPSTRKADRLVTHVDRIRAKSDDLYARDFGPVEPHTSWPYYPANRYMPALVTTPTIPSVMPWTHRRRPLSPEDYAYLVERLSLGYAALSMATELTLPALGASSPVASGIVRLWRSAGTFDLLLLALEAHYWKYDVPSWTIAAQQAFDGEIVKAVHAPMSIPADVKTWLSTPPEPSAIPGI